MRLPASPHSGSGFTRTPSSHHLKVSGSSVNARSPHPPSGAKVSLSSMAFLFMLLFCASSWAVEVEPSRLELKIPADQPTRGELQLSNPGQQPVEVTLSAGPYRFLDPKLKLPSCQDWLRFEPDRLTLGPGATTSVAYTVTPPSNLNVDTAGEYLGAILVDQLPAEAEKKPDGKARLTVVPRLALAVYVMIQGKERVEVELSGVKAGRFEGQKPRQGMREPPPDLLRIDVTLKNRGTVHVRPAGTTALFDGEGHLYRSSPLGKSMPLLPTAVMTIPALLPLPPAGSYRLVTTIEVQEGTVLQKETLFEVASDGTVIPKEEKTNP